jgi:hypothetical protein
MSCVPKSCAAMVLRRDNCGDHAESSVEPVEANRRVGPLAFGEDTVAGRLWVPRPCAIVRRTKANPSPPCAPYLLARRWRLRQMPGVRPLPVP